MRQQQAKEVLGEMSALAAAQRVRPKTLVAIFAGDCEHCGARRGEPCRGTDGKLLIHDSGDYLDTHKERRWQAKGYPERAWLYAQACGMMSGQKSGGL